jgi:quinolinate synthase
MDNRSMGSPHGDRLDIHARRRPDVSRTAAGVAVDEDPEVSTMTRAQLIDGIERLRRRRHAVILAHNYQIPDVQDVADFVGDSLELSKAAAETDAAVIAFCGVHFMAETASILCPNQQVLIPDLEAACSLATSITAADVERWRDQHPHGVVVAYVNTPASVKARSDICCTSANAVDVVNSIATDRDVFFLPDFHLGRHVEHLAGRPLHLWIGECHVHADITARDVHRALEHRPSADLLLHPECGCVRGVETLLTADPEHRFWVVGTGGMVSHVETCTAPVDVVGTEVGMIHRLRKIAPQRTFEPVKATAICEYMKTITLPKLYRCLRDLVYEVRVPRAVAIDAKRAIDRMLAIS